LKSIRIGDRLKYQERIYVVRSVQPMSIPNRLVDLEDAETGARISVLIERLDKSNVRPT
jgi:hypothetical protein